MPRLDTNRNNSSPWCPTILLGPALTAEALESIYTNHPHTQVIERIAGHPHTPAHLLRHLAEHSNPLISIRAHNSLKTLERQK